MGLRRRGPRLTAANPRALPARRPRSRPGRHTRSPGRVACCLALTLFSSCFGLAEEEQARLDLHVSNALTFLDSGAYPQALQQAGKALELDSGLESMQLVRGAALLRIGKANSDPKLINEAMDVAEDLSSGWLRDKDFRVYWLLAQCQLARAFLNDDAIDSIGRRLATRDYRDAGERRDDQDRLERERENRRDSLLKAESNLQRVLADPRQADNHHVLTDLVVTLNEIGGREDDVLATSQSALVALDEASLTWRQLQLVPTRTEDRKRLDQNQIDNNLSRERQLRDIIVTIYFNRGDYEEALAEYEVIEERQLMTAVQHYNRAGVYEQIGDYVRAIDDYEQFLRIRSRFMKYADDDMAPQVFEKLDELRRRAPATTRG